MQFNLKAVLLCWLALAIGSASYGFDLCGLLGVGTEPCGCGNGNCCDGCEPNRWIGLGRGCEAPGGCEPSCSCSSGNCCESACGCGSYCLDGRSFAGQKYNCGCDSYVPTCGCTGPSCCEPACGCEPSCGCSSSCEPSCGCSSGCNSRGCSGLVHAWKRMGSSLYRGLCGGGCGCSGEVYWSEWHNDPPRCCEPCNRCGQSDNGYDANTYYSSNRPTRPHGGTTFAASQPSRKPLNTPAIARANPNTNNKAKLSRNSQPVQQRSQPQPARR